MWGTMSADLQKDKPRLENLDIVLIYSMSPFREACTSYINNQLNWYGIAVAKMIY